VQQINDDRALAEVIQKEFRRTSLRLPTRPTTTTTRPTTTTDRPTINKWVKIEWKYVKPGYQFFSDQFYSGPMF